MTAAPARGEHGAAEPEQLGARRASLPPRLAAGGPERSPGDRADARPGDDAILAGDGYQPVLSDDTLQLAVSFVLVPAHAQAEAGSAGAADGKDSKERSNSLLRRGFGRLGWGVADQAVSSITNAAISIYAARSLPHAEFGAFSLAYVTYAFALNASRGLATDPLMVRFSSADRASWRRAVGGSTGTALTVGVAAGVCVVAAAMAMSGTARLAFLALGLTLPGLMLQDSWRYSFFAIGRGSQAFLSDTIWALAMLPGLYLIRQAHHENVFWFVLIWGAAGCLAGSVGPLQSWVIPRLSEVRAWVSSHRDLGPRYLAENTANSGASQLRSYGLGLITGLAAVGYVQAASTLMGPFMVVFMGMSLVTVPEAARVLRRAPRRLPLFCLVVAVGLTLAALAWGAFLLIALPRGFGQWLLGPIWRPAYPVVLPTTLGLAGATCIAGASAGLRAMGASKRSLRTQVTASVAYVAAALVGAFEGGAVGAVWGSSMAIWAGAILWWWQLHRALRESDLVPEGQGLWPSRRAGRHSSIAKAEPGPLGQPDTSDPPGAIRPTGES
jgi:O-antigen/teichoic acid export membrane protein